MNIRNMPHWLKLHDIHVNSRLTNGFNVTVEYELSNSYGSHLVEMEMFVENVRDLEEKIVSIAHCINPDLSPMPL